MKFEEAFKRVRDHSAWRMWESLESGASKILNFNGWKFRKDVWSEEEKLMMQIINRIESNKQGTEKSRQIKKEKKGQRIRCYLLMCVCVCVLGFRFQG